MTAALKEHYSYQPIEQIQYDTLSFSHSEFSQTYNIVKANETLVLGGVTYSPSGFKLQLPEKGGNQQDLSISLNNVDSNVILDLEAALNTPEEAIQVIHRTFINTDPTTVQSELTLSLKEIAVNQYTLEGRATNINLYDSIFPRRRFNSWEFTGLTI